MILAAFAVALIFVEVFVLGAALDIAWAHLQQ